MSAPYTVLYERMKSALFGYAGLVDQGSGGLVPQENCRPADDPLEAVEGASVLYSLTNSGHDLKSGKFEGVMAVSTGSAKTKIEAHEIMDEVRKALVPRALAGGGILVMLFKEQAIASDAGKTNETWRVITAFDFRFVEGTLD